MNPDTIKTLLIYSFVFNYALLMIWFCVFSFAHDWLYRLHNRWFHFSPQSFDTVHYAGMVGYKIGIILLNIAPLVALWLAIP